MNIKDKIHIIVALLIILTSCVNSDTYFEYKTVDKKGWNRDSIISFNINNIDTISKYNIYIHTINSSNYPYQNLWVFMKKDSSNNDTLEIQLMDNNGKWLGSGAGATRSLYLLYKENVSFAGSDSAYCRFEVGQAMRDSVLKGIEKIGLRIEKVENKNGQK